MMSLASQTLTASGERWHEWNGCSATCDGLRHRSRHIALQGSGHGKFCIGVADEVQNCDSSSTCEREAKVDCQWSEWNSWSPCSVTCGGGQYNRSRFEKGHWTSACPITGKQVPRDGEEAKTSFFVYFGRDHSTSDYIGKGVIDTGCSRFLIGQNTLEKWEEMLTRRWGLSTQRIQLAKAMTFRFGNDETLETRTLAILPVGIAGVNGVLRVYVVPGGAPLLLSKEFLRDLGCHIDLGRGHLFFEKLGVRTVVTSKQSPHLLLPLTSFGPQGHRIPAEIQPRISSDECAIYRATCDSPEQNKILSWIASTSDHQAPETDSTHTESLHWNGWTGEKSL